MSAVFKRLKSPPTAQNWLPDQATAKSGSLISPEPGLLVQVTPSGEVKMADGLAMAMKTLPVQVMSVKALLVGLGFWFQVVAFVEVPVAAPTAASFVPLQAA